MNITTVLSLSIVATVVSLLVQFLKVKFGTSGYKNNLVLIALSLLVAVGYYFLRDHQNWLEIGGTVLVIANAIYSFLIKPFENPQPQV